MWYCPIYIIVAYIILLSHILSPYILWYWYWYHLKMCFCNLNLPLSILFYLAYCPILLRHIILIKVSADTNLLNCKTLLGPKYFIPIPLLCCILQKQLVNWSIGEYNVIVYWYIWLIFHIYDKWLLFHIPIDWLIDWFSYIFVYLLIDWFSYCNCLWPIGPCRKYS